MSIFDIFTKKNETEINDDDKPQQKDIKVDFSNFNKVTNYIYQTSGIVDLEKRALTSSRIQQYAQKQNIYDTNSFLDAMKNDKSFYQEILNIATVNETFFMREIKELNWLIEHIKNSPSKLHILSMPSSTGEEIYSILIMMSLAGINLDKISIKGFDINSNAITKAQDGIYDDHSIHKLDEDTKNKYFTKVSEGMYQISLELRTHANFEQKNIFDLKNNHDRYDIILSRNMFIYFDSTKRKEATDIIADMLKDDGIFIKGHADNISEHKNLEKIAFGIYKKIV